MKSLPGASRCVIERAWSSFSEVFFHCMLEVRLGNHLNALDMAEVMERPLSDYCHL